MMLVFPAGAAGVLSLKLGLEIVIPLTWIVVPPEPTAASISIMFSAKTSSMPHVARPRFVVTCASPPGYINDILFSL